VTSYIGRDAVEDQLWKSGIRSNVIMKQLLQVIDAYAYNVARGMQEPLEDVPPDKFAHLLPGQGDTAAKVTRCITCERVKPWKQGFFVDKMNPTGFGVRCKYCIRVEKEGRKGNSRLTPGKTDRMYYCKKCDSRKPLEEFPEAKLEKPTIVSWCSWCIETYGDPRTERAKRSWRCRYCEQVKDEDQFPEAKRENPRMAAYCLYCETRHGGLFSKKRRTTGETVPQADAHP
jgi:aspartate carbamoyltransferase regulatory subunit